CCFFFSSRRRHTRSKRDWSSDVCSSDLEAETIFNFARPGFSEDNPQVTQLLKNLVIDDENLSSLENVMFSEENYGGEDLDGAVEEWVGDNGQFVEDWKAGALG